MKNFVYGVLLMTIAAGCASRQPQVESAAADKTIAITFDDGPSSSTEKLLDVLRENDVKATFFLIGQNIRSRPEQTRLIFAAGHEIGNHSDGYVGLGNSGGSPGADAIRQSLAATSAAIREATGKDPVYFRAPNLDYSDALAAVAGEMGMALIGTDVIGRDWEDSITTEAITANVLKAAKDGGIILLHERHEGDVERTIRAVPVIVRELRASGYEIVSVGELAKKKGARFEAGKRYDTVN